MFRYMCDNCPKLWDTYDKSIMQNYSSHKNHTNNSLTMSCKCFWLMNATPRGSNTSIWLLNRHKQYTIMFLIYSLNRWTCQCIYKHCYSTRSRNSLLLTYVWRGVWEVRTSSICFLFSRATYNPLSLTQRSNLSWYLYPMCVYIAQHFLIGD